MGTIPAVPVDQPNGKQAPVAHTPDLLGALKEAQSVLATLIEPRTGVGAMHLYFAAVAADVRARAAISKATGE